MSETFVTPVTLSPFSFAFVSENQHRVRVFNLGFYLKTRGEQRLADLTAITNGSELVFAGSSFRPGRPPGGLRWVSAFTVT